MGLEAPEPDFRQLFEESPDVLLVLLPDAPRYTMVAATRARLEATHTTREQIIGRGLFELFPDNPDDPAASGTENLRASLERVRATRQPDTMAVQQYDIRKTDGTFAVHYWSPKNLPVLSPSGELLYILHRVEDVTEMVKASELGQELAGQNVEMQREVLSRSRELSDALISLREANTKLGELDAAKTVFFSNVSHELRTPLTLMLGPIADVLADDKHPLDAEQRARVELAYDNALRLLKLVNALLDFSRLEAGRMNATYAQVDLGAVSAQLAGMFQSAAVRARLRLVIDCPPMSEPAWVDRDLWEKIVANLVSNALKFTFEGEVAVRLREEAREFILSVSDTGVGIAAPDLPRVFERFYRAPNAASRSFEGTGIGLSLVHDLAKMHGGRVSVKSTVGEGTTFEVAIPKGSAHLPADSLARSEQLVVPAAARRPSLHAVEALRWDVRRDSAAVPAIKRSASGVLAEAAGRPVVLVVDDNPDLRKYMATLLSGSYMVVTASDGLAALEAVKAYKPDLVLSDVMMPRLDGFGMIERLRADPATASLPVILLSARAGEEAAIQGLDAGADDYLAKPFSSRELLARVRTHLSLARARAAWTAQLVRANEELDAFSYSVSHDLRAPLRAVQGFSQLLLATYGTGLDAKAQHYLDRIVKGVERMGTLIDALLELARISRTGVTWQDVDLSSIAASVVADLRQASPGRSAYVEIEAGLTTRGDPRLLRVVLVNLVGNAWKFTAKVDGARILIGRSEDGSAFFVRDNGAGFDMAYAKRLFSPFQRLHGPDEFEGTGIGLATVARVISRHGGKIWAESEPEKGATFFFTLEE